MGWKFWKRTEEPDYETLLSGLETSIKARESRLLSIRLRERRANALFITYGLGLWAVYLMLWYFGVASGGTEGLEKLVRAAPIVGGPVGIIFTRRTMRWWFTRQRNTEEKTLLELKKQQREKVEELKRKTGYYSTRNLLEKYDEVTRKNAEIRGLGPARPSQPPGQSNPSTPSTPARKPTQPLLSKTSNQIPGTPTPFRLPNPSTPGQPLPFPSAPVPPQSSLPLLPPAPSTPAPRTVFDKLADALLGVAGEEGTPNSKYALICGKCFNHNGLVVKEEFDTIQYRCPRCGYLNPRRKPLPVSSSDSLTPASEKGHRRRVQSLHISSSTRRPGSDEDEDDGSEAPMSAGGGGFTPEDFEGRKDEKEEGVEPEMVSMDEQREKLLRQRRVKSLGGQGGDLMDVDEN